MYCSVRKLLRCDVLQESCYAVTFSLFSVLIGAIFSAFFHLMVAAHRLPRVLRDLIALFARDTMSGTQPPCCSVDDYPNHCFGLLGSAAAQ